MKTSHGLGIKEYAGIEREGGSFFFNNNICYFLYVNLQAQTLSLQDSAAFKFYTCLYRNHYIGQKIYLLYYTVRRHQHACMVTKWTPFPLLQGYPLESDVIITSSYKHGPIQLRLMQSEMCKLVLEVKILLFHIQMLQERLISFTSTKLD